MALSEQDQAVIETYREWLEESILAEDGIGALERRDHPDGSTLATRFEVGAHVWVELAIRPIALQLQASILTDDRWFSEEMETAIEDSGDTMGEFVEMGFDEQGLDWEDPPVSHYRDAAKCFYFSTPWDIQSLDALAGESVRTRSRQMVLGYRSAFTSILAQAE